MTDLGVVAICITALFPAFLTFVAFREWLAVRYRPAAPEKPDNYAGKLRAMEERLSTIELQRGITRVVPGTKP